MVGICGYRIRCANPSPLVPVVPVFRPPEAEWRAPTTAPPACRGVAGSPVSGADRWPVDAAAVAEAFRMTDAAWESAVEAADVVMLYEATAATRASAALAEEAARYEEEYTAEYGERADLEALYAAAAWAKVAALGGARRGEGDPDPARLPRFACPPPKRGVLRSSSFLLLVPSCYLSDSPYSKLFLPSCLASVGREGW